MYKTRNGQNFYDQGWQLYSQANTNEYVNKVTFPKSGTYKVTFTADEVGVVAGGTGSPLPSGQNLHGYYPENRSKDIYGSQQIPASTLASYVNDLSNPDSYLESGWYYAAFYGIVLTTNNNSHKWILIGLDRPSTVNESFSNTFYLSQAEFGNGNPMKIVLYIASRDGHSWSENGTVVYNPKVFIETV